MIVVVRRYVLSPSLLLVTQKGYYKKHIQEQLSTEGFQNESWK